MNYRLLPILLCLLIILSACAVENNNSGKENDLITPQPHSETKDSEDKKSEYGDNPSLSAVQSVSYIFTDDGGKQLYMACELKNTSDSPCVIDSVTYTYEIASQENSYTVSQPGSSFCVVYPGEVTYNACWHSIDTDSADVVIKSVNVDVQKSTHSIIKIEGSNTFIVKNYPEFATLSGDIKSSADATANLIYCGMYDSADRLIGVWCFSENTELVKNTPVHFTTHMRQLSIEDIAENASKIYVTGYGYNAE